ncbi:hypothetical protein DN594_22830 [Enterobacter cloacae]|nr:hypothetical protein EKO00_21570 [Enterobacter roggenkampii]RWS53483.1 hypothetical protein DN594_22830 [Enterobacter cloacae]
MVSNRKSSVINGVIIVFLITGASESVCSYAAKLSHQFPPSDVFFVSEINKRRQIHYPNWSKSFYKPRQYWLEATRIMSPQRIIHL